MAQLEPFNLAKVTSCFGLQGMRNGMTPILHTIPVVSFKGTHPGWVTPCLSRQQALRGKRETLPKLEALFLPWVLPLGKMRTNVQ